MKIYFTQVKRILDSLPIGLYIGHRVPVYLDEDGDATFYDLIDNKIVISYPIIESAMEMVGEEYAETCIRGLLYHELSHAIRTPKNLMTCIIEYYGKRHPEYRDVMNIFEDQRIEEYLRYYYHGVDFKKNLEIINNWDILKSMPIENAMDAFFRVVRFGEGKEKWVERSKYLIEKYEGYGLNNLDIYRYMSDVIEFYREFEDEYCAMTPEDIDNAFSNSCNEDGSEEEDGDSDGKANVGVDVDEGDNCEVNNPSGSQMEYDEKSVNGDIFCNIKNDLEKVACKCDPTRVMSEMLPIIASAKKKNCGGSAMGAYSGTLNPRRVGTPDYRIFDRKAQERGANKFGTIHLNLFLDESGSFWCNQDKANEIIAALSRIEKMDPNFTFDIVYCGIGERIVTNKNERQMNAFGGNKLDEKIFEIYRKLQKPNTYNYNIVLFDGDAFTDVFFNEREQYHKNFGAFNHSNCTIISNNDNKFYIETYAKSAKRIYTADYVEELQKHVVNALRYAFR